MFQSLLSGFKGLFSKSGSPGLDAHFRERRKLVRLRCSYEAKGELRGKKFKVTIVDIGLQGLKLRTGQALKVGDTVSLTPPLQVAGAPTEPVQGKVLWVKRPDRNFLTYAGVLFTGDNETMSRSWVKMFLKELGFTPKTIYSQRRFIRAECFLEARCKLPGARQACLRVYNMGVGGLLVESPHDLPIGQTLHLELGPHDDLPLLRLPAVPVQYTGGNPMRSYGLEFGELEPETLEGVSRYLKRLLKACWSD